MPREQLLVPGAGDLVEREPEGTATLGTDVEEDDRDGLEASTEGGRDALVATDDDAVRTTRDDGLDEGELVDAAPEGVEGGLVHATRVGRVGNEGGGRDELDGEGWFEGCHGGLQQDALNKQRSCGRATSGRRTSQ